MKTRITTSIPEAAWDRLVRDHPDGTIYHTTSWARCVSEAYGIQPLWLIAEDRAGGLAGGIPLAVLRSRLFGSRLSSFPCAQYCGPLASPDGVHDIFEALVRLKAKTRVSAIDLKVRKPPVEEDEVNLKAWQYYTHDIDLAPPESELLGSFHKSCILRPLSSAQRSGLRLRVGSAEADVTLFYRLYSSMRKSRGLLPAPMRFFVALQNTLMRSGQGEILSAIHDDRIISSILMLYHGSAAIYEYGATLETANSLHPSQFLLWEAMKRAKARGCTVFNLGRTDRGNQGLLRYKQRWGARLVPLESLDPSGRTTGRRFGVIPTAALKSLMKATVRFLPRSSCVLIGTLVYGRTL